MDVVTIMFLNCLTIFIHSNVTQTEESDIITLEDFPSSSVLALANELSLPVCCDVEVVLPTTNSAGSTSNVSYEPY